MPSSRTNVTKRACDGCKIRKIRCGGGHPCKGCTNARIKCTYIRVQQQRGPQRLRATTAYLIEQTQKGQDDDSLDSSVGEAAGEVVEHHASPSLGPSTQKGRCRITVDVLAPPLYIYHVRMYPVWPIVDVEHLVSILQRDIEDAGLETYALATSIAAATIAQLRLGDGSLPDETATADTFAEECLKARMESEYKSKVDVNNVCTSFFLHVYYENQQSGGSKSLLYLREAISLAQMMNLHRESSYAALPLQEQQIRRRVLWLLFVTERGVCILHKLPVVLRTNVSAPEVDANDESHVLPAFLKLLNLFRLFERSRMFDIIEGEGLETEIPGDKLGFIDDKFLETLQDKLEDGSMLFDHISDVQKADLCVTRHWMRMILWKLSSKQSVSYQRLLPQRPSSPSFPVAVARELLNIVSQLPRPAIEAHGLGMELKLYEIANSLADSIMKLTMLPRAPTWEFESRPSNILSRLHSILSTFRGGGNKTLVDMLYKKMAEAETRSAPILAKPLQPPTALGISRQPGQAMESSSPGPSQDAALAGVPEQARPQYWADGSADGLKPVQDLLCIEPMDIGNCDDLSYGANPSPFDAKYSGDYDYGYIAPMHPLQEPADISTLAPSWSSYDPVEMMIGDFLAQVPGAQFLQDDVLESMFTNGDTTQQAPTGQEFMGD